MSPTETLTLRQVALVARDLDPVREAIRAVFGQDHFHVDPAVAKFGLENCVFPFGGTFLEVISPVEAGTTAGRLLDKRGGDGGYMVIVQTSSLEAARERALTAGVRIVSEYEKDGAAYAHLHPRDTGGTLLSFDWMDGTDRWDWAGPGWREHVLAGTRVHAVEIQAEDPGPAARRWGELLLHAPEPANDSWRIPLDGGEILLTPPRDACGDGLRALVLETDDAAGIRQRANERGLLDGDGEIVICGTVFRLIEAE